MTTLGIVATILAVILFGAFVLFGAWIDGRRQKILEKGLHPVTTSGGNIEAQEDVDRRKTK